MCMSRMFVLYGMIYQAEEAGEADAGEADAGEAGEADAVADPYEAGEADAVSGAECPPFEQVFIVGLAAISIGCVASVLAWYL